jgi:hypothetical protein
MKSKLLLIIVLLAVVGGGYYAYSQMGSDDGLKLNVSKMAGSNGMSKDAVSGSLMELATKGIPLKCEYSVQGNSFEGIIKGKNFLGKVKTPEGKGNILMKQNCMYTWEEGAVEGISWCFDDSEQSVWEQTGDNMPDEYKCRPTVVTDSAFNMPAGVTFMNLSDMMDNMENYVME